ncbi:NUDIX domain-containing protein [Actinoplanes sp. NPDC051859]|uniref:NUDIX domain-containing protein n=1 Tax=Actinoplanes sp. NPDC051859 TaxID=3363909 RepID=UPI0037897702
MMRWTVHSEETLYQDKWVHLLTADVELPDGRHLDHRLIRTSAAGAGLVVVEDDKVLLIWRHRFITDTYGWEIPLGSIEPGEDPATAAAREAEEETGWKPHGPIEPLLYTQPSPGLMGSEHYLFRANAATYTGPPSDDFESDKVDWVPLGDVYDLIRDRQITAGTTLNALLMVLANTR